MGFTHVMAEGIFIFLIWHFILVAPQSAFDVHLHDSKIVNQSHGVVCVPHEILAIPKMLQLE